MKRKRKLKGHRRAGKKKNHSCKALCKIHLKKLRFKRKGYKR